MTYLEKLRKMLAEKADEARSLNEEGKLEEAEAKLEEVRSIKKKIAIQEELDAEETRSMKDKMKNGASTVVTGGSSEPQKATEEERSSAFLKAIQGKPLTDEQRALVQSATGSEGGYLVPKAISTQINELKRQYKSVKDVIGVVPVSTESGSFVMEDSASLTELVNFNDTNTGLAEQTPAFKNVEWAVKNYGAVTPIAKAFLQDETANFMAYLSGLFARKAIRTENKKAFEVLPTGKTAKAVTDLKSLKKVVNVDLDPAIKGISVFAMNQDGFNFFDAMEDGNGRPLLQQDPVNKTQYLLLGLPVHVFSNAELPTTGTTTKKARIFVGAISEGVKFFDRGVYEVAISTEAAFTKAQTVARVIERFDVKQGDVGAYEMIEVDVTGAAGA
jgi:HK97 family phage major capsid protein